MDKIDKSEFVASFKTVRETRFKTSKTAIRTSVGGQVRFNEIPGKWVTVPPGSEFFLINYTATPDAATLIMTDAGGEHWSIVLRERGWRNLISAVSAADQKSLKRFDRAA